MDSPLPPLPAVWPVEPPRFRPDDVPLHSFNEELAALRRFLWVAARCSGGALSLRRADWLAALGESGELVIEADAEGNIRMLAE